MIELPRAALTAFRIAEVADFFSFGTNDLTQTTWGFSRDDVEAAFFAAYLSKGVFTVSPFESLDVDGVGRLVRIAVEEGRRTRPELHLGVCGEHGGDPESIHFFHHIGIDYVSCSPFRVPIARLEAGRATLRGTPPESAASGSPPTCEPASRSAELPTDRPAPQPGPSGPITCGKRRKLVQATRRRRKWTRRPLANGAGTWLACDSAELESTLDNFHFAVQHACHVEAHRPTGSGRPVRPGHRRPARGGKGAGRESSANHSAARRRTRACLSGPTASAGSPNAPEERAFTSQKTCSRPRLRTMSSSPSRHDQLRASTS